MGRGARGTTGEGGNVRVWCICRRNSTVVPIHTTTPVLIRYTTQTATHNRANAYNHAAKAKEESGTFFAHSRHITAVLSPNMCTRYILCGLLRSAKHVMRLGHSKATRILKRFNDSTVARLCVKEGSKPRAAIMSSYCIALSEGRLAGFASQTSPYDVFSNKNWEEPPRLAKQHFIFRP